MAKLIELDSLELEQSAFFYLDSLPKKEFDFNLKQLGGHISDLKREPSEEVYDCTNNYSKKEFYRVFKKDDLKFKPSTQFSYSNYATKL